MYIYTTVCWYLYSTMARFESVKTVSTVDTVQTRPPYPLFTPIINKKPKVGSVLIYLTMFLLFPAKSGANRKRTRSNLV